jgi:hypothetical protein
MHVRRTKASGLPDFFALQQHTGDLQIKRAAGAKFLQERQALRILLPRLGL